ncbi:uncharacterized protein N7511_009410 [Penicillium nucicola]|uniref:uncharacterized protein n=1 Tax=Penicillium nucicola TaxID=1850975 RepID=UPI002545BB25|nr:uncharacterized protein N7511_009410 [Penicillium nucicola]KAJ5747714.1 hypothetical protein N7511_009410 [Penicillium nucicola]
MPQVRGDVQWCFSRAIDHIYICSSLDQGSGNGYMVVHDSFVQRGIPDPTLIHYTGAKFSAIHTQ